MPGLRNLAFDISGTIPPDSWYGTLLKGVLNLQPTTSIQVTVWALYLVPTLADASSPVRLASGKGKVKVPDRRDRAGRSPRRLRSLNRFALTAGAVTVLSLTASGCVVVHGEREVVPTRPDRGRACARGLHRRLQQGGQGERQLLDADRVTGALGAIDGAKLTAGQKNNPGGNPFLFAAVADRREVLIPAKAGWPRWFVADAAANKGVAASLAARLHPGQRERRVAGLVPDRPRRHRRTEVPAGQGRLGAARHRGRHGSRRRAEQTEPVVHHVSEERR